jgi:hypothetical protein
MSRDLAKLEVKVGVSIKEIIAAIAELDEEDREFLIENLLAATSPEYLESIKEAREEYKRGEVVSHERLFEKLR